MTGLGQGTGKACSEPGRPKYFEKNGSHVPL